MLTSANLFCTRNKRNPILEIFTFKNSENKHIPEPDLQKIYIKKKHVLYQADLNRGELLFRQRLNAKILFYFQGARSGRSRNKLINLVTSDTFSFISYEEQINILNIVKLSLNV